MRRVVNLLAFGLVASVVVAGLLWTFRGQALRLFGMSFDTGAAAETTLHVPEGYDATVFASGLVAPRFMARSAEGVLFVAESGRGRGAGAAGPGWRWPRGRVDQRGGGLRRRALPGVRGGRVPARGRQRHALSPDPRRGPPGGPPRGGADLPARRAARHPHDPGGTGRHAPAEHRLVLQRLPGGGRAPRHDHGGRPGRPLVARPHARPAQRRGPGHRSRDRDGLGHQQRPRPHGRRPAARDALPGRGRSRRRLATLSRRRHPRPRAGRRGRTRGPVPWAARASRRPRPPSRRTWRHWASPSGATMP